jgi:hypothetical protein
MAKKSINITLHKSEIIYDIQNKTYLTGLSRDNGDNAAQVAHMQANNDEENLNQVMRSVQEAYATMRVMLGEYLTGDAASADNILEDANGEIEVKLSMPSNYNAASNDAIASSLHSYIVNVAIADWFSITNKPDAADYLAKASANMAEIKKAISNRTRPQRPIKS